MAGAVDQIAALRMGRLLWSTATELVVGDHRKVTVMLDLELFVGPQLGAAIRVAVAWLIGAGLAH